MYLKHFGGTFGPMISISYNLTEDWEIFNYLTGMDKAYR